MRGFGISKGVNAFDYCAKANIIATGGVDKVIRVWHPHIFSRPTGKLYTFYLYYLGHHVNDFTDLWLDLLGRI